MQEHISWYENILFESKYFLVVDYRRKLRRKGNWRKCNAEKSIVVYHHTAGNYLDFPAGAEASANYCIDHRGWTSVPYHYYVPYKPVIHQGKHCVFLINDTKELTWHTKGANTKGIGVVFQGKFSMKRGKDSPSNSQTLIARDLWEDYFVHHLGFEPTSLRGHFDYGKIKCPGWELETMIRAFQAEWL